MFPHSFLKAPYPQLQIETFTCDLQPALTTSLDSQIADHLPQFQLCLINCRSKRRSYAPVVCANCHDPRLSSPKDSSHRYCLLSTTHLFQYLPLLVTIHYFSYAPVAGSSFLWHFSVHTTGHKDLEIDTVSVIALSSSLPQRLPVCISPTIQICLVIQSLQFVQVPTVTFSVVCKSKPFKCFDLESALNTKPVSCKPIHLPVYLPKTIVTKPNSPLILRRVTGELPPL